MFYKFLDKKISEKLENSFFVIDKEAGRTSHDEVHFLRRSLTRFLGHKIKVGHSGTLDPKVTGVLVLASGRVVKGLEYILLSKKVYVAEFLFHQKISRELLDKNLEKFRGKITQLPPIKSAVKRQEREREVYELEVLDFANDGRSAELLCAVERGTYIRKLAHDLGLEMEVNTSMGDLRRTQAGVFSDRNSNMISEKNFSQLLVNFKKEKNIFKKYSLYKEIKKHIYPLSEMFHRLAEEKTIRKVFVKKDSRKYISSGTKPRVKNIIDKGVCYKKDEMVSVFCKNQLLAVGEFTEDLPQKDKTTNTEEYEEFEIIKLKKVFK